MPSPVPQQGAPVLSLRNLGVQYEIGGSGLLSRPNVITALENISFDLYPGETIGLVGESGSGKTTLGRAILRQVKAATGSITFNQQDITNVDGRPLRRLRRGMQVILQDPYASLNPRMRVADIIAEPLLVHRVARSRREAMETVSYLLDRVGLPANAGERYPHAFSGGQRQRIGIARALALKPKLIVADEPVSALDVSVRAQVVNLMREIQREMQLSYIFIAHDLSIVRHISHRVAILYAGQMVEFAEKNTLYKTPLHPYTEALLSAVPLANPAKQRRRQRIVCDGEVPDILNPPSGCRFQSRCPLSSDRCRTQAPPFEQKTPGHWAACWNR
ncbi:oligopeptide/dipeptide ABC transporter ATP-binding protein [Nitratireductor sp. GISD-1A_MAKvit]|uniref:ABC transporter ATP-binding protein n=1 Tax=Nitratireductor sp. GISD-1A_MAKvit TaxID=3234198 RepID=UPI003466F4C3